MIAHNKSGSLVLISIACLISMGLLGFVGYTSPRIEAAGLPDWQGNHGFIATPVPASPPIAICKNVTVTAGPNCTANASIDGGSYDAGGLPITLAQAPLGPHHIGNMDVTLTATNRGGASSQCTGTVTVIDTEPPAINILRISPASLWPPNQEMLPVRVTALASDSCSPSVTCKISSIQSNEPADRQADMVITGNLTANLRADRLKSGTGRIYGITVQCTDGAGNSTIKDVFVTVPHDQGK
jgi:hypothetical protein